MSKKLSVEDSKHKKEEMENKDKEVQEMIASWDIVKCRICGKQISMMDARLINDRDFVCKGH